MSSSHALSVSCVFLFTIAMAGCSGPLEAARAACIRELESIYGVDRGRKSATFERVSNRLWSWTDFEFLWTKGQIVGLAGGLTAAERRAFGIKLPPVEPGYVVHTDTFVPVRDYVCRGSLAERKIEGIWRRFIVQQLNPVHEIRITDRPVSF